MQQVQWWWWSGGLVYGKGTNRNESERSDCRFDKAPILRRDECVRQRFDLSVTKNYPSMDSDAAKRLIPRREGSERSK